MSAETPFVPNFFTLLPSPKDLATLFFDLLA